MFYKKLDGQQYIYVAIQTMTPIRQDTAIYGQKHFCLHLADGTNAEFTFENDDWVKFSASFKNGGAVINPQA